MKTYSIVISALLGSASSVQINKSAQIKNFPEFDNTGVFE